MRVIREELEEALHVLVHQRVVSDVAFELIELLLVGQLAVEEQVGHFDEAGLFRELIDGIAAVAQDAQLAVEEGDGAGGGAGVLIAEVERDVAGLVAQFADVDRLLAFAAREYGELVGLAVEDDLGLLAHRRPCAKVGAFFEWPLK